MLFDREQYYRKINSLKSDIFIIYFINILIAIIFIIMLDIIITDISTGLISILIFTISLLRANIQSQKNKLQIMEMQWKLDVYDNIYKIAKKED